MTQSFGRRGMLRIKLLCIEQNPILINWRTSVCAAFKVAVVERYFDSWHAR